MKKYDFTMGVFGALWLSVPFYFVWNRLAPTYCYWLPQLYQHLPFWHCVGLFFLVASVRAVAMPYLGGGQFVWFGSKKGW